MKPAIFSLTVVLTILFAACKKDKPIEPIPTPPIIYPDYSQLKVGNYWVYQHYEVDSNGNSTALNVFDTCFVEKDTLINGNTYYKLFKPLYIPSLSYYLIIRDSLHYTVTSSGEIIFSSEDFTSIFSEKYQFVSATDTLCLIITKMEEKDVIITTPAGNFITSNSKNIYYMYPPWNFAGNLRIQNTRYAKNIGVVSETLHFFVSNPNYTERRLVSYHLN
ncbi:MAG: hypothetical protein ACR2GN_06830 [Bacteroidia bacterium]